MKTIRITLIILISTTLMACSGAEVAQGEGSLIFVDGGLIKLDLTEVSFEEDDETLLIHFDIVSDQGEGQCDMEAYPREQAGSYQVSVLACNFSAGGEQWSTRPPSGQQTFTANEGAFAFTARGDLSKNARTGPPYEIMFEGTY